MISNQEDKLPIRIQSKKSSFSSINFACGAVFSQKNLACGNFFFCKNDLVHGPFHFSAFFKFTDLLVLDSWSLDQLGHLYPVTTPVVIKLDHNWSCHWV